MVCGDLVWCGVVWCVPGCVVYRYCTRSGTRLCARHRQNFNYLSFLHFIGVVVIAGVVIVVLLACL